MLCATVSCLRNRERRTGGTVGFVRQEKGTWASRYGMAQRVWVSVVCVKKGGNIAHPPSVGVGLPAIEMKIVLVQSSPEARWRGRNPARAPAGNEHRTADVWKREKMSSRGENCDALREIGRASALRAPPRAASRACRTFRCCSNAPQPTIARCDRRLRLSNLTDSREARPYGDHEMALRLGQIGALGGIFVVVHTSAPIEKSARWLHQ